MTSSFLLKRPGVRKIDLHESPEIEINDIMRKSVCKVRSDLVLSDFIFIIINYVFNIGVFYHRATGLQ